MIQSTRGIVLRSVKYGETSLVLTLYTEHFGIQHYLVQGVRTDKKGGGKANLLQPSSLLDLVVYHQPGKNLQRIKEFKAAYLYQGIQLDVLKNSVALFMVELLYRTLTEEEAHPDLFDWLYESFMQLDGYDAQHAANMPLVFSVALCRRLGFGLQALAYNTGDVFDIENGCFLMYADSTHGDVSNANEAAALHGLLEQGLSFKSNGEQRFQLLQLLVRYIRRHHPEMHELRSVAVLHAIWR
jgi:DNA repair protein RecO (recombination protein O)